MKRANYFIVGCLAACAVLATSCGDISLNPLFDQLSRRQVAGTVTDDAIYLPTGSPGRIATPLAGALVQVASGPDTGRSATSSANGTFDLGVITTNYVGIRVTLAGWDSYEGPVLDLGNPAVVVLGRAPHVLWGDLVISGSGTPVAGARVEIVNGPNAGQVTMTSETGGYRLDDLATQGNFTVEFSKAGYRTDRITIQELRRNTQRRWSLAPSSDAGR